MTTHIDRMIKKLKAVESVLPPETNPRLARSAFSAILAKTHESLRTEGVSHHTIGQQVGEAIGELDLATLTAIDPAGSLPNKRQPTILESFQATLDRYIVIDEMKDVFSDSTDAMIYGGSMSYGPFFNVRSGTDSSDIDVIAFTNEMVLDEIDWRGIMETDLFEEKDKITFFARLNLQRALVEDGLIDITSQRFTVTNGDFTISSHIVPTSFLSEAFPLSVEDSGRPTSHKYVRDYKERPFERTHVNNYDMSRVQHDVPVYNTAASGGFVAANPAYSLISGRYVPGMYQNLVLPNAKYVRGSHSHTAEHLEAFAHTVAEQEEREKQIDPNANIRNTEPRMAILPVDVSDILAE